jgi:nucleotide-binding universal stress UspA family protein
VTLVQKYIPVKKILVLTKLSQDNSNLTQAAAMLAARLHFDILLFNYYPSFHVTPFHRDDRRTNQDTQKKEHENQEILDKMAADLTQYISLSFPEENVLPVVSSLCTQGRLEHSIKHLIANEDFALVIMGSSSESSFKDLLKGNNTRSVIDHIRQPILVIPRGVELKDISKVVFATNYSMSDIKAVNYLSVWANTFHAELDVVHVDVFGEKQSSEMVEREIFLEMLEDINHPNLKHKLVHGKEVFESLKRFCSHESADLLGLSHYQDTLIMRIARESTSRNFLDEHTIPVIIFPSQTV